MAIWPALLLAPLLLLGEQSLTYALTPAMCGSSNAAWLNLAPALSLLVCLGLTAFAARALRHASGPRLFLAQAATGMGALSSLTLLALWIPQWVLHPCQW